VTAAPVQWVLDELGSVADAVAATYTLASGDPAQLRRVDRDNALVIDTGGSFDMTQAMDDLKNDLQKATYVGARFADRSGEYAGTAPQRDLDEVVGVRILGYSGSYGHVDPLGEDGIPFQGTDDALVERIQSALYDQLQYPDAGRTNVGFTHLDIVNEEPVMADWQDFYRYDFDVVFDGFETL